MRDSAALLVVALACALAAWVYWRYLRSYGATLLIVVMIAAVVADNWRLRRKLRRKERKPGEDESLPWDSTPKNGN